MNLEKMLDAYFEHFGENYPLMIVSQMTDEEVAEDIRRCIESGVPAESPEYEEGLIY